MSQVIGGFLQEDRPGCRSMVFGCPVDDLTMDAAVARVEAMIASRTPSRVGAVNAAKFMSMAENPELDDAVRESELVLCDGVGVVWASWILSGTRLRRVTGIDLMDRLLEVSARRGYRVFLFGARQEVVDDLLAVLQRRLPALVVAGSRNGYFSPEEEPQIVEQIHASKADLLFVAMGTPAKELWIHRNFRATGVPVSMGVGGSFDVFSGSVQRAPVWLQRLGLEWFYRFAQEPRRLWRRYFVTSVRFFFKVLLHAVRRPFPGGGRG